MTKTLILMRHAKSSWDDPALDDRDRPLNKRGRTSAAALGDWLKTRKWLPDQVLCSPSVRTVETFDRLALASRADLIPDLYHAAPDTMRTVLCQTSGKTVMMLGHNPGIGEFAARLLAAPPAHARFCDYPTGATLIARFDIDGWRDLDWGRGMPISFVVPRELVARRAPKRSSAKISARGSG
ncbi:MAG: histidine phosphatase family protein [Rhodobacteraceae bacterium]|nr:histidine phosphatase family protein [Paracoccaceae bacterium]